MASAALRAREVFVVMPEMLGAPKGYRTFWPVLASEKVRFVGERVALVVA